MKEKILVFIIGVLVGAIVATSACLIYQKKNPTTTQNETNTQVIEKREGGTRRGGEMSNGEIPPEMPNGETIPEMPDGETPPEMQNVERNEKKQNTDNQASRQHKNKTEADQTE